MRKELTFVFILFLLINLVSAVDDPGDVGGVLKEEFNLSNDVPTSQEDLDKIRNDYLKSSWNETIGNITLIGPIHKTFTNNPTVFKWIFGNPYEFSWFFLTLLILWILTVIHGTKIVESFGFISQWGSFGIAIVAAILFSHLIYKPILGALGRIINALDTWWIRLIFWFVVIIGLAFIHILAKMFEKSLKEKKLANAQQQIIKGAERVKTMTEDIQ